MFLNEGRELLFPLFQLLLLIIVLDDFLTLSPELLNKFIDVLGLSLQVLSLLLLGFLLQFGLFFKLSSACPNHLPPMVLLCLPFSHEVL